MKKEIQIYIVELLSHLHLWIPTEGKARHILTVNDQGQLSLTLFIRDNWKEIIFDENYEDVTPEQLAVEICDKIGVQRKDLVAA